MLINSDFYAFDDNFVVSKRKKGSGVPEKSEGGTREFHWWNSRVPALEVGSSTAGSREFHCWNSTSRLQIIRTQRHEDAKKSFPAGSGGVNTFFASSRLIVLKNINKSTANCICFEKSTAIYIVDIEYVIPACSRFSSFFQTFITRARRESPCGA